MITGFLLEGEHEPAPSVVLSEFLFHETRHGEETLRAFEELAAKAMQRGWPKAIGADTLRGWARGEYRGFSLSNGLASFYVARLWLRRSELRPVLCVSSEFVDAIERGPGDEGNADDA